MTLGGSSRLEISTWPVVVTHAMYINKTPSYIRTVVPNMLSVAAWTTEINMVSGGSTEDRNSHNF